MVVTAVQMETCPACGQEIRIIKGYHLWCANCNWNIDPDRYELKRNNAFVYCPLFSKQTVLVLGIPLLAILDRSEILALLGHELGHIRNKDMANRRYLSLAFSSLCEWYQMIRFNDEFWIFKMVMYPLRLLLFAMISLIGLCLWRQQQLGEYGADRESVRLAGVQAAAGLIQKSYHGITFELTVEKAAGYSALWIWRPPSCPVRTRPTASAWILSANSASWTPAWLSMAFFSTIS